MQRVPVLMDGEREITCELGLVDLEFQAATKYGTEIERERSLGTIHPIFSRRNVLESLNTRASLSLCPDLILSFLFLTSPTHKSLLL